MRIEPQDSDVYDSLMCVNVGNANIFVGKLNGQSYIDSYGWHGYVEDAENYIEALTEAVKIAQSVNNGTGKR